MAMSKIEKIAREKNLDMIERLCNRVDSLKKEVLATRVFLNELDTYLRSSKFYDDTTVQVSDILLRVSEFRSSLNS